MKTAFWAFLEGFVHVTPLPKTCQPCSPALLHTAPGKYSNRSQPSYARMRLERAQRGAKNAVCEKCNVREECEELHNTPACLHVAKHTRLTRF